MKIKNSHFFMKESAALVASRAGAGAGSGVFRVRRGAMTEERYRRGWLREVG